MLVYQLGACRSLLKHDKVELRHVVGASGGAIAATVVACLSSDSLDEYAARFIEKRGGGLELLRDFLDRNDTKESRTTLHIATTRCADGQGQLFSFSATAAWRQQTDKLLRCVEASCRIPPTFHPYDVISSSPCLYPEHDGIVLDDGAAHVDGGIATPAPPTPPFKEEAEGYSCQRVIVSPVSGSSTVPRISPDTRPPQRLWWREVTVPHDLGIHLSWDNLRALRGAAGLVSSDELQDWYERGQRDADETWRDLVEESRH